MYIYYLMNDNKEIVADGFEKFDPECSAIDEKDYHVSNGYNGHVFFNDYMQTTEYRLKAESYHAEQELKELRRRRERECFPIVNRGEAWYRLLLEYQRQELYVWYQQWLDVTETRVIPQKPTWMN